MLGRPLPSGQGTFTATIHALPYAASSLTGAGDPLESSGTFQQLFNLAKTAIQTAGGVQTFSILDPSSNTFVEIQGILNLAKLIANTPGGLAAQNVTIEVNSAFIPADDRGDYTGGDTVIALPPPYIPGDPLPPPDPTRTYGWNVGGWNNGYWGRGEGVPV